MPPGRINYVAFSGGGESLSAILGGQVSVGHQRAGRARAADPGRHCARARDLERGAPAWSRRADAARAGCGRRVRELAIGRRSAGHWQRASVSVSSRSSRPWLRRPSGERHSNDIDGSIATWPGDEFVRFVDREETRVRATLQQLDTGQDGGGYACVGGRVPDLRADRPRVLCGCGSGVGRRANRAVSSRRLAYEDLWHGLAGLAWHLPINLAMAETVGFVIASTAMFWLTARAFDDRHPVRDGAVCRLTMAVAAYVFFGRLLQLPLPAGPLETWISPSESRKRCVRDPPRSQRRLRRARSPSTISDGRSSAPRSAPRSACCRASARR